MSNNKVINTISRAHFVKTLHDLMTFVNLSCKVNVGHVKWDGRCNFDML